MGVNGEDVQFLTDVCTDKLKAESNNNLHQEKPFHKRSSMVRRRFLTKSGRCAARKTNRLEFAYLHQLVDFVSCLLEWRWRYLLLAYSALFLVSWFLFALLWWLIAYAHDDLTSSPHYDPNREKCVSEVKDLINAFMFSMETQYTTGYGSRTPTTECPEAIFMLCVQNIVGMLLQSTSLGIIYAKLSRPKARTQAIKFSEKAVISMRDGYLCLMFRIADLRKSHVICCEFKAWALKSRLTIEGELIAQYRQRLHIDIDEGGSDSFLVWPVTVIHRIDSSSPLYDLSADDLYHSNLEIVASLSCTIESTGQQVEVLSSYVPAEILWGHRFKPLIRRSGRGFDIDYSAFDLTSEVETALCSPKSLYLFRWSPPPSTFIDPQNQKEYTDEDNKSDLLLYPQSLDTIPPSVKRELLIALCNELKSV